MSPNFTITNSTSVSTSTTVRLYHGTNFESAQWIRDNGLDAAKAAEAGGEGYFWGTDAVWDAGRRAIYTMCDKPQVVVFDLSCGVIATCRGAWTTDGISPLLLVRPLDEMTHYRFHWDIFPLLNQSIVNVTLIDVRATSADQR